MANPEHLRILQQGIEAWNQWRREPRDSKPDLTGAKLMTHVQGVRLNHTIFAREEGLVMR
jgi:hypothetical protein